MLNVQIYGVNLDTTITIPLKNVHQVCLCLLSDLRFWPTFDNLESLDYVINKSRMGQIAPKRNNSNFNLPLEKGVFRQSIFANLLFSPLGKACCSSFEKLESPSPRNGLCQVWLKMTQWFWRRILNFILYIFYLLIISPWKTVFTLHLNTLELQTDDRRLEKLRWAKHFYSTIFLDEKYDVKKKT